MSPELAMRLSMLAQRHETESEICNIKDRDWHARAAADIRAAIVSADDATKNMLILRAHKAKDRRFSGEAITGFDQLEGQS